MARQRWDQQLTERDSEHRAFDRWLRSSPRPAPAEIDLAERQEWALRAQAYDLIHDMPVSSGARLAATVDMLVAGTYIQSARWLQQLQDFHCEVNPAEITKVLDTIARLKEVADAGRERKVQDLSDLDELDLLVLDEAHEVAKRLGN